jgi:hypothetical protein
MKWHLHCYWGTHQFVKSRHYLYIKSHFDIRNICCTWYHCMPTSIRVYMAIINVRQKPFTVWKHANKYIFIMCLQGSVLSTTEHENNNILLSWQLHAFCPSQTLNQVIDCNQNCYNIMPLDANLPFYCFFVLLVTPTQCGPSVISMIILFKQSIPLSAIVIWSPARVIRLSLC